MVGSRSTALGMHAVLALAAVIVILPVVWIALAAFKTQIALLRGDVLFTPVWTNFNELLFSRSSDYLADARNSLIVASISTALVVFLATLAAYSLHRLRWPRWVPVAVLGWSMIFHMLPPITMVGPWYVMFRGLGLDNTYAGLVLAHLALNLPVGIWLMSVFVREIPLELEEAARVDGCTTPQMLWRIVFPLVAPGLAATAIIVFRVQLERVRGGAQPDREADGDRAGRDRQVRPGIRDQAWGDGGGRRPVDDSGHRAAARGTAAHRQGAHRGGDPVSAASAGRSPREEFVECPPSGRIHTVLP